MITHQDDSNDEKKGKQCFREAMISFFGFIFSLTGVHTGTVINLNNLV